MVLGNFWDPRTLENSGPLETLWKHPVLQCLTENVALECYFLKSHDCTVTNP